MLEFVESRATHYERGNHKHVQANCVDEQNQHETQYVHSGAVFKILPEFFGRVRRSGAKQVLGAACLAASVHIRVKMCDKIEVETIAPCVRHPCYPNIVACVRRPHVINSIAMNKSVPYNNGLES